MDRLISLISGVLLGAVSWGMAYMVSGTFEPFDSGVGFLVTQIILSSAALMVGFKKGVVDSFTLVFGGYIGMIAYAYAFGGSEIRAWILLGFITTISLVCLPALAGLLGGIVSHVLSKSRRRKAREG